MPSWDEKGTKEVFDDMRFPTESIILFCLEYRSGLFFKKLFKMYAGTNEQSWPEQLLDETTEPLFSRKYSTASDELWAKKTGKKKTRKGPLKRKGKNQKSRDRAKKRAKSSLTWTSTGPRLRRQSGMPLPAFPSQNGGNFTAYCSVKLRKTRWTSTSPKQSR